MPKTIAKFKCKLCDDIFTATSNEYVSCKCGKCCVQPTDFSTSYKSDNGRGLNFIRLENEWVKNELGKYVRSEINDITYYYENDFYIMTGDILNIFNEVKLLCEELDFSIYESFKEDEIGNKYLAYISYTNSEDINEYSHERNIIEFTKRFEKQYTDVNEEKFKNRLLEFKNFLINVKNNNINITDRKQMISDELNLDYDVKQLKEYDYTFYF